MTKRTIPLMIALALAIGGCKDKGWNWWKKDAVQGDSAASAPAAETTPQEREIERITDSNRTLDERLTETRNRSDLLSKKVKQLEFVNAQLRRQLAAVGDAPRERDRYKARADRLDKHVKELELQLTELVKLRAPQPTTRPGE